MGSLNGFFDTFEYLYYPVSIEGEENNSSLSILRLTEDCRFIISKPFD